MCNAAADTWWLHRREGIGAPTARAEGTGRTKRPAEDGSGDTVLAIQQSLIVTHRDGRDPPILPISDKLPGAINDVIHSTRSCR